MPQIRQVVSESLQATVRRLLPSQQGFTEDLQASNVIQPIIDLTPSAEGSALPTDLARAISYGGLTSFAVNDQTTTVINNAGFWRVLGTVNFRGNVGAAANAQMQLTDGVTPKTFDRIAKDTTGNLSEFFLYRFEYTLFLPAGISFVIVSTQEQVAVDGHYIQIADVSGNLVNPSGFTAS